MLARVMVTILRGLPEATLRGSGCLLVITHSRAIPPLFPYRFPVLDYV